MCRIRDIKDDYYTLMSSMRSGSKFSKITAIRDEIYVKVKNADLVKTTRF
jgi:hypothetical protein